MEQKSKIKFLFLPVAPPGAAVQSQFARLPHRPPYMISINMALAAEGSHQEHTNHK
jgi:hypothetical protein